MRKRAVVIILLLVVCLHSFAEENKSKIDSILENTKDYYQSISLLRNQPPKELTIQISKSSNDLSKCKLYNALCWVYFNSDPPKAMQYAKLHNSLAEKTKNQEAIIASYDNLAYLYLGFSDSEKAVSFMLKALKAKEAIHDEEGVAVSMSGLAGTYYEMNNYKLALKYYEQIYELFKKENKKSEAASTLSNMGLCYVGIGEIDKGLNNYLVAVEEYKEIGMENLASITYSNIGQIYYRHKQDYENALKFYKISSKLGESKNDISLLSAVYSDMSEIFSLKNDFANALIYGKKAVSYAKQTESKKDILNANKSLALAFYNNRNYQFAYDHFMISFNLKDSIFNENSSQQIAEMQTKYDTEKKETENNLLKAEKELDKVALDKKASQQRMLLVVLLLVVLVVVYIAYSLNQKKKINKLLNTQNEEISHKNEIIQEKNKDITDSINYAQRIQNAILPPNSLLETHFQSFIYYRPKDIVSGDFYWIKEVGDKLYFAVVDCTGHGVPGAFMSIIGYNSLNRIVEDFKITETGLILDKLDELVLKAIINQSKDEDDIAIRDGMDISICCIDKSTNKMQFSGAQNPLYLIRDVKNKIDELETVLDSDHHLFYEIKADKMAIGGEPNKNKYKTFSIQLEPTDSLYLFSDGYADQFGGPKGKKFMYKQFKQMIFSMQNQSLGKQFQHIDKELLDWKGKLDQIDDICLIGLRI